MGAVQRGLSLLSTLPTSWHLVVIDIKDCFFSIPLYSQDTERLAYTVPTCNHGEPDQRYEWIVLPQGMANSPTMCQIFVGQALRPIRQKHTKVRCIHYMDDVLLVAKNKRDVESAYLALVTVLREKGLAIAPRKSSKG